jgi:hypothetical protein
MFSVLLKPMGMNRTNITINFILNTDKHNGGQNVSFQVLPTFVGGGGFFCTTAGCAINLNNGCPEDLKEYSGPNVVGCKSSCLAYNTDEYCCRGAFQTTCVASPSAVYFKDNCPGILSFPRDTTGTFICQNTDYDIFFSVTADSTQVWDVKL